MTRSIAARRLRVAAPLLAWLAASPAGAQELTLSGAVTAALGAHPALAAAAARVESAARSADAARGARLPTLSMSASLTRFQEPMIIAPLHSFDPFAPPSFDATLVQARLAAQYTLFDAGDARARSRSGDARAEAARYGASGTEMEVLELVVTAYVDVVTARTVRDAADAQVAALEAEQARVERNLAVGTAAEVEVLRSAATLQDARAQAASAGARVALAERSLARLTGLPPARIAGRDLAPVSTPADTPAPGAATSPRVEQAARAIDVAEAALTQQGAGRWPRVDAMAGVLDFGNAGRDHTAEWQAGLQLSWPLFNGGAVASRTRAARADLRAAQDELALAELTVRQEQDAAETAVLEADARAGALAAAEAQWAEVARIERLALDTGSGVQTDLLRAQAGLFQARAGRAQARRDGIAARVRLARALGTLDADWIARTLEAGR